MAPRKTSVKKSPVKRKSTSVKKSPSVKRKSTSVKKSSPKTAMSKAKSLVNKHKTTLKYAGGGLASLLALYGAHKAMTKQGGRFYSQRYADLSSANKTTFDNAVASLKGYMPKTPKMIVDAYNKVRPFFSTRTATIKAIAKETGISETTVRTQVQQNLADEEEAWNEPSGE